MLLVELITPRAEPKIAQAKDILSASNRQVTIFQHLEKFLKKNKFVYLGQGIGGIAFERPGYPWVFKIFRNDPAYFHFLQYAITHQDNPNLPKIKGKFIRLGDGAYAVRMEKLQPLPRDSNLVWPDIYDKHRSDFNAIPQKMSDKFKAEYPGIWRALKDTYKPGFILDLHVGNVMMRGKTPVLIDPWVKSL